jgi:hypothetical protein
MYSLVELAKLEVLGIRLAKKEDIKVKVIIAMD